MQARATLAVLIGLGMMSGSLSCVVCKAQSKTLEAADPASTEVTQRTRLILKDGSYQAVLSYRVEAGTVAYRSAERNGELEEITLRLVDMPATIAWYHEHVQEQKAPQKQVLSPELIREEAARASLTPEVSPNLHLPQELSVVALDAFQGTPELVPIPQRGTDLNRETAHGVLKQAINPSSSSHRILELQGPRAEVQLHVAQPTFFVRVGGDLAEMGGGFVVDTRGAGVGEHEAATGGAAGSVYVLERLDTRANSRIVDSFRIAWLNSGRRQPEVIELREEDLPGGHWLRLTPTEPLEPGEYALVEIVSDHEVNLNVWDFGVHSDAKENLEAQRPDVRGPATLKNRTP